MYEDVFRYRGVFCDTSAQWSEGPPYRFLAYREIAGRTKQPGAAILDDTQKLVLIDQLFEEREKHPIARIESIASGDLSKLISLINAPPNRRHTLNQDGSVPW